MRNNKGLSIINVILIIVILICIGFISLILSGENKDNNIGTSNDYNSSIEKNYIKQSNNEENGNEDREVLKNFTDNDSNNTTNNKNEAKKYYYYQLSNTGKSIYDTISNNISALKDGYQKIEFDIKSADVGDEFQSAWDALILDKPELFWVDTNKIILTTKTTTFLSSVKYSYILEPREGDNYFLSSFINSNNVENSITQVDNKVDEIVNKCVGNTYDKVKIAHDELVDLISYDQTERPNNSNVYGALIEKTCICEGYAESFKIILDKLNIPCVLIYGDGVDANGNTEAHAWNEVKMDDGKWYAVDVTWDDPIILGHGTPSDADYHRNFLKGSSEFEKSHKPNGDVSGKGQEFTYPTLAMSDY